MAPSTGTSGLRELALFAGGGGGLLGTHLLGFIPVCAVEKEPYRREVLLRRQRDGVFPLFPIWDDVRTFDGRPWRGKVDIVTAGFPCQPFSVAGKQRGAADERNMWPDTIRIIREVGPRHCILENVPQLVRHDYFGVILGDLAEAGFDAKWDIVSAADVGAPHLRRRLWIVADAKHGRIPQRRGIETTLSDLREQRRICGDEPQGVQQQAGNILPNPQRPECESGTRGRGVREDDSDVANANIIGLQKRKATWADNSGTESTSTGWWDRDPAEGPVESRLGRVASRIPNRVDRLAGIGDAQVPAVVVAAWTLLSGRS